MTEKNTPVAIITVNGKEKTIDITAQSKLTTKINTPNVLQGREYI